MQVRCQRDEIVNGDTDEAPRMSVACRVREGMASGA